jgi:hypothetical protein
MPHRVFRDADGVEWQVWNVVPHVLQDGNERRVSVRRRPEPAPHDPERREVPERRTFADRRARLRMSLSPSLEGGWLVFEAETEKRRITPIPEGWDSLPDEELDRLRLRAAPVPRRG